MIELTITIKDSECKKMSNTWLLESEYEPVTMNREDPIIQKHLKELLDEFKGEVDDIKIKTCMIIK